MKSAQQLYRFIEQIRRDYSNPRLKVDLIAHSMGGLIARYFLRYGNSDELTDNDFEVNSSGVDRVRRVILLGTPNLGSVQALHAFIMGKKIGFRRLPPEALASMPSVYQTFPHALNDWIITTAGRPLDRDLFDIKIWRRFQWSIFDPEIRQRIIAQAQSPELGQENLAVLEQYFEIQLERARRFVWSLTVPIPEDSHNLIVFGGDWAVAQERSWPENILQKSFDIHTQAQIDAPLDEVHQGCPKRDCIPSIDAPYFVSAAEARNMEDEDLILGLESADPVRAYPAFILNHHEVVNDTVGGVPVAITYCPLCGSGVAFQRTMDGETMTFGVSGLLHNSDLILYDRETESLWQQITGVAIAGPSRGQVLKSLPLTMTTWRDWYAAHPDTRVLTGNRQMDYADKQPYGDYNDSKRLMFPANSSAALILHPKQVVYGLRVAKDAVAVTERLLARGDEIKTATGAVTLTWRREADGKVVVRRGDTGEDLLPHRMFWFAWYSFNTDTTLRDIDQDDRLDR